MEKAVTFCLCIENQSIAAAAEATTTAAAAATTAAVAVAATAAQPNRLAQIFSQQLVCLSFFGESSPERRKKVGRMQKGGSNLKKIWPP